MIGLHSRQVNFKEVFTIRTLQLYINPFITVTQFIDTIRPLISIQFGINENDIELIESGQYELGCLPEAAPELMPSNAKLCHRWGETLQNLAFYVRQKNQLYPQIEEYNKTRVNSRMCSSQNNTTVFVGECPICLETLNLSRRYNCTHGVCSNCYNCCQRASINACSLCRSSV